MQRPLMHSYFSSPNQSHLLPFLQAPPSSAVIDEIYNEKQQFKKL